MPTERKTLAFSVKFSSLWYFLTAYFLFLLILVERFMPNPYGADPLIARSAVLTVLVGLGASARLKMTPLLASTLLVYIPWSLAKTNIADIGKIVIPISLFLLIPCAVIWTSTRHYQNPSFGFSQWPAWVGEGISGGLVPPLTRGLLLLAGGVALFTVGVSCMLAGFAAVQVVDVQKPNDLLKMFGVLSLIFGGILCYTAISPKGLTGKDTESLGRIRYR